MDCPGDWECDVCGQHNFAHRVECFRCSAERYACCSSMLLPSNIAQGSKNQVVCDMALLVCMHAATSPSSKTSYAPDTCMSAWLLSCDAGMRRPESIGPARDFNTLRPGDNICHVFYSVLNALSWEYEAAVLCFAALAWVVCNILFIDNQHPQLRTCHVSCHVKCSPEACLAM